jgi:hypothetical protein
MALARRQSVRQYAQSMLSDRSRHSRSPLRNRFSRSLPQNILAALGLSVPLLLIAQALTSCGSDDPAKACNPGDIHGCTGVGMCTGEQVCNDAGSGYGACDCSTGGGGTGGTNMSGGAGNAGTSSAGSAGSGGDAITDRIPGGVGFPCASDTDCPTDAVTGERLLTCLVAGANEDFGGGGPQGGYCSLPCVASDDCREIDTLSTCGITNQATGASNCIALCQPGAGQLKCGANRAQACFQADDAGMVGGCFPLCSSDAACGPGRFCDPGGFGLCVDAAPAGGGVGAPCTQATEAADCASSICLEIRRDDGSVLAGFCTANCTYGGFQLGCGYDAALGGVREAACLQARYPAGRPGDLGYCFELCDADTDCTQDNWECSLFNDPAATTALGRTGQCIPAELNGDAGAP